MDYFSQICLAMWHFPINRAVLKGPHEKFSRCSLSVRQLFKNHFVFRPFVSFVTPHPVHSFRPHPPSCFFPQANKLKFSQASVPAGISDGVNLGLINNLKRAMCKLRPFKIRLISTGLHSIDRDTDNAVKYFELSVCWVNETNQTEDLKQWDPLCVLFKYLELKLLIFCRFLKLPWVTHMPSILHLIPVATSVSFDHWNIKDVR